jgi:hypothetical protein
VQLVEVRFLRDGRVIDVDTPLGTPSLDARDVPGGESGWRCALRQQPLPEWLERRLGDDDLVALQLELRHAGDDGAGGKVERDMPVARQSAKLCHVESRGRRERGARPRAEDAELARGGGLIIESGDARIDVLPHHRHPPFARARRGVDEQRVPQREDAKIGDDLSLRRERGRVAPLAGHERADVVGHESGDQLARLGSADAQPSARAPIDEHGARAQRSILLRGIAVVEHDGLSADVGCRCAAGHWGRHGSQLIERKRINKPAYCVLRTELHTK